MAPARVRLSRSDWVDAALGALAEQGLAGVAVEPLAAGLGVTKGSFYAHFANRDELLDAALDSWTASHGRPMLDQLRQVPDPLQRLRTLFAYALAFAQGDEPSIHLRLLRDAHDERVRAALARVSDERIAWLTALLAELGHEPAAARRRAEIGYATFVGLLQTSRDGSRTKLGRADADALTADLVRMLAAP